MVTISVFYKKMPSFFLLFLLMNLFFCISICSGSPEITARSIRMLHTFVEIKVCANNSEKLFNDIFAEMERVNSLLNNYNTASEISKININAGGQYVPVSVETMEALNFAVGFAEMSGGAFDFTVGPLLKLWGFAKDEAGLDREYPSREDIEKYKALVDYRSLKLELSNEGPKTLRRAKLLKKHMTIDVGAFSKGYVSDCAMKLLKKKGFKNVLVTAGGTIVASGNKPDASLWKIGIRHPRKKDRFLSYVELKDCAVSTSGDYEKFYMNKNKRVSHIIDPRTGMPVDRHQSVTVIAKTGIESDALSTALFVMNTKEGIGLVNGLSDVEALIIDQAGQVFMSSGWPQKNVIY